MTSSSTRSGYSPKARSARPWRTYMVWIVTALILLKLATVLVDLARIEIRPCGRLDELLQNSPCVGQIHLESFYIYSIDANSPQNILALNGYTPTLDEEGERQRNGEVRLMSLPTGETQHTLPLAGYGGTVDLSPDGTMVATEDLGNLKVWQVESGELVVTVEALGIGQTAFSPDGTQVTDTTTAWNVEDGSVSDTPYDQLQMFFSSGFVPIFSAQGDVGLRLSQDSEWNTHTFLIYLEEHDYWDIYSADWDSENTLAFYVNPDLRYSGLFSFSDDGQYLASTASNNEGQEVIIAWDVASGEEILNIALEETSIPSYGLAWLPEQAQLVVAVNHPDTNDSRILFFNVNRARS